MTKKTTFIFIIALLVSFTIQAQPVTQSQLLLASDGQSDDMFGNSLAVSGDFAVFGTPQDDDINNNSGAAYIYEKTGTTWNFSEKLTASDSESADRFGEAVDIDGDYIVVGAYQAKNGTTENTGTAYIYKRNGATWELQTKIYANDSEVADNFGKTVAISGEYIVVGAPNEDLGTGAAYVFHRSDETWTQVTKFIENDAEEWDYFANSVDIDGDYIVAGTWHNNAAGSNSGAAYIFYNNGETWEFQAKLVADDASVDAAMGYSVAISGNSVVAGAHAVEGATGAAYIFVRENTTWSQQAKLTANNGSGEDFFGKAVSISADYVIVGSQNHDMSKANEGSAYLYTRDGTIWNQQAEFTASDASDTGLFGYCVAIEGDFAFISTVQDNGVVYVFGPEGASINKTNINNISIHPNPTSGIITINNLPLSDNNSQLTITDITGKILKEFPLKGSQITIDLSNFNTGIYLFKVETANGVITKKIILN